VPGRPEPAEVRSTAPGGISPARASALRRTGPLRLRSYRSR
jgi:hypothetical protein